MKIVEVNLEDIKEYPDNAKIHTDEDIERLANIIDKYGFDVPVVLDENKELIKGHKRYRALKKLNRDKAPAIIRNDLTEAQKRTIRINDNKVSEGEYNLDTLRQEMDNLVNEFDIDIEDLGFNKFEFDELMQDPFGIISEDFEAMEGGAFSNHLSNNSNLFEVTFTFEKEHEELVKGTIKEKGKDYFREMIVDHCKELKDA